MDSHADNRYHTTVSSFSSIYHSGASRFWHIIPFIPLNLRKPLVDICQVGEPVPRITSDIDLWFSKHQLVIPEDSHPHVGPGIVTRREFDFHIEQLCITPLRRSISWMLLRCLPECGPIRDEESINEQGFLKELEAASTTFRWESVLNYLPLMEGTRAPATRIFGLDPPWSAQAKVFAQRLAGQLTILSKSVIFPDVQRRKFMAHGTGQQLVDLGWIGDPKKSRTVDLEIFYARSGMMVQGAAEMRRAWRYNDLKPRFYYATGGTDYWAARYMRKVAVAFMNSWPSTHQSRRSHPDLIHAPPGVNFYIWDYTSFTTSLSELKHFIYAVGRYVEDEPLSVQNPLTVFDYRHGLVSINPGTLLLEYNQTCNMSPKYSIHRLADKFGLESLSLFEQEQRNNGMLGVPGNIGMSTALHGLHLDPISSFESTVIVGDDAMSASLTDRAMFVRHLGLLGHAHPEKMEIWNEVVEGELQVWKFIKRRLERTTSGIQIFPLLDIPLIVYILETFSKTRTVYNTTKTDCALMVIGQFGSLFWKLYESPWLIEEDEDMICLRRLMEVAYRRFNLPRTGALPGQYSFTYEGEPSKKCLLCIPALSVEPRGIDWSEELYDRHVGEIFTVPRFMDAPLLLREDVYPGELLEATGGQMLSVLEDLGYISIGKALQEVVMATIENRRVFKRLFQRGLHIVYEVQVLRNMPEWFEPLVYRLRRESWVPTPWYMELEYDPEEEVHDLDCSYEQDM